VTEPPFAEYPLADPWYPERFTWRPGMRLAGVDEVGRGPLVGPVVTAAVILDPDYPIEGLADSKKLTQRRREKLAGEIRAHALDWALGRAEPREIDELNIQQAALLAMARAARALSVSADAVLADGHRAPDLDRPVETVVKGDARVPAISAASILAKVARDEEMLVLHERWPQYGFDRHKGYPTPDHRDALKRHGALDDHRRSFAPVAAVLAGP
jgi:ribonuclease HII